MKASILITESPNRASNNGRDMGMCNIDVVFSEIPFVGQMHKRPTEKPVPFSYAYLAAQQIGGHVQKLMHVTLCIDECFKDMLEEMKRAAADANNCRPGERSSLTNTNNHAPIVSESGHSDNGKTRKPKKKLKGGR